MKYNSRKLKTEKNLKNIIMFIIWSHNTQNVKELQLAVKVV
jgi:hypothetical protein